MLILVLSIASIIIAAGILACIEAALFSVSPIKVNEFAASKTQQGKVLKKIRDNLQKTIAAVVILTDLVNIGGPMFVGVIVAEKFGSNWVGISSGIMTFLFIIFAEIIPKNLGERYSFPICKWTALPLDWLSKALTPLIWLINLIAKPFLPGTSSSFSTNENEIRYLVKMGHSEGIIEKQEQELINRTFELNDVKAEDIATPRTAMTYLRGDQLLKDCSDKIINSQHTRIVIVGETLDEILGFARKDHLLGHLIKSSGDKNVKDLANDILRFSADATASFLLSTFQKSRNHIGIVMDPFGGVTGIVTLEDVLELLAGEIVDENDRAVDLREYAKKMSGMGNTKIEEEKK